MSQPSPPSPLSDPPGTTLSWVLVLGSLGLLWGMVIWVVQDSAPSPWRALGYLLSILLFGLGWHLGRRAARVAEAAPERFRPQRKRAFLAVRLAWAFSALVCVAFLALATMGSRVPARTTMVKVNLNAMAGELAVALDELAEPPETRAGSLPKTVYPPTPEGRDALVRDATSAALARLSGSKNPYDGGPAFEWGRVGDHLGTVYVVPPPLNGSSPEDSLTLVALLPHPQAAPTQLTKKVNLPGVWAKVYPSQ